MQTMAVDHLIPGMIVVRDVLSHTGELIVGRGKSLTKECISHIQELNVPMIDVTDMQYLMKLKNSRSEQAKQLINLQVTTNQSMLDQLIALRSHLFWGNVQQLLLPHLIGNPTGQKMLTRAEKIIQTVLANPKLVMPITATLNVQANKKYLCHVVAVALVLGIELGLTDQELNELGRASLLYNYGYVTLVMNKYMSRSSERIDQIQLTDEEMDQHPQVGYQAIKQFDSEAVAITALEHHERFGGGGKPFGKEGEAISFYSRIICVAKKYISLIYGTNNRPALAMDLAYDFIVNDSHQRFDPKIVEAFQKWFRPFPNGICVELSEGSLGIVATQNVNDPFHPNVYITGSNSMMFRSGQMITLSLFQDIHIKRIR